MNSIAPACPRCGCDLSGDVATWIESCPLAGRCSECGAPLLWRDLLTVQRRRIPGFVECDQGLFRLLVAAWRTWAWAILPWIFWRRIPHERPPHVARASVWLAVVLLGPWALARVIQVAPILIGVLSAPNGGHVEALHIGVEGEWMSPSYVARLDCYGMEGTRGAPLWGAWRSARIVVGRAAPLKPPFLLLPIFVMMTSWPLFVWALSHFGARRCLPPGTLFRGAIYQVSWVVVALAVDVGAAVIGLARQAQVGFGHSVWFGGLSHWSLGFLNLGPPNGLVSVWQPHWVWWTTIGFLWTSLWWFCAVRSSQVDRPLRILAPAALLAALAVAASAVAASRWNDEYQVPTQWAMPE